MFKKFITKFQGSDYLKNVITLASGTTIAQAISILTAPILYRIYDKVDYGTLGLYIAIVGVIGVFSTMQYLQPILLEKNDDDAKKVMWLNRLINTCVTAIVFLLVLFMGENIAGWLNNPMIYSWLFLIPISIFFSGQNEIFGIWANRKKKYRILTINTILTAVLVPIISITFGLIQKGPLGLFLGLLTSQVIPAIVLLISLTRHEDLGLRYVDFSFMKIKIKEYSNFPLYSLPSEFINRLTNQLPVFMLSSFVGPAAVGIYNLAVRMIGLPIQLIGGSIGTVFRQRASADFNNYGSFRNIYIKTFKSLAAISIPMLLFILLFGPQIFAIVFGPEWKSSGVIAQILMFMFVMKLIVSPLSYTWFIINRLQESFYIHIYMLISNLIVFYVGFKFFTDYKTVLIAYAFNYILIYLYSAFRTYHFSHNYKLQA